MPNIVWLGILLHSVGRVLPWPIRIDHFEHNDRDRKTGLSNLSLQYFIAKMWLTPKADKFVQISEEKGYVVAAFKNKTNAWCRSHQTVS